MEFTFQFDSALVTVSLPDLAREMSVSTWADWFNHRRLLGAIGNIPPAEAEECYDAMLGQQTLAA
jgi:transposase InsO family protein